MTDVNTSIEYLRDLPLYKDDKPYWCFLPPHEGFDPDKDRVDNLEFEERNVTVRDLRGLRNIVRLEEDGFEVLSHSSEVELLDTESAIQEYKAETEELLKRTMNAEYVKCYDHRLRENITFRRTEFDLNNPLHTEGPARGAHNDITIKSGPDVITRYLPEQEHKNFLTGGYRVRIVNTWRSLRPVLVDRPLALCDSRSVSPEDLVAADRIVPTHVGEVYYLKYNQQHRWYWLSNQTNSEPFAFVMYDTKGGKHGRFCPHVSFRNPDAGPGAPPRKSIETRSIVITKN